MSMVGVSAAAWERMKEVNYQGYDAILPFRTVRTDGRCPYTPNWHGVAALYAGTQAIFKEGMDAAFARHEAVAAQCPGRARRTRHQALDGSRRRQRADRHGGHDPRRLYVAGMERSAPPPRLICTGSFGPMDGKVFRLGHMGTQAQPYLIEQALDAIAATLGK